MKLYLVSVEMEVIVYAENEADARSAASDGFREALSDYDYTVADLVDASEEERKSLPWIWFTCPEAEDDLTVGEILDREKK